MTLFREALDIYLNIQHPLHQHRFDWEGSRTFSQKYLGKVSPISSWILSGDHPAKHPGKTQYNPLPHAKPERTRAVPGLTANISVMENINHLLPEAAWDMVTKHREGAAMVLGEL